MTLGPENKTARQRKKLDMHFHCFQRTIEIKSPFFYIKIKQFARLDRHQHSTEKEEN